MQQSFSRRLRSARVSAGIKSGDLARLLGISAAYLSQLENGKRNNPSEKLLNEIAEQLNTTVDYLQGCTPPPTTVREGPSPAPCRYPEDCDLPAAISKLDDRFQALEETIQTIQTQMSTLLTILGEPLRKRRDQDPE